MSDNQTRVYLAGPVRGRTDGGNGWRIDLQEHSPPDIECLNPLDRSDRPDMDRDPWRRAEQLVANDESDILHADAMLVNWHPTVSVGTPMEVMFAWRERMPIVVRVDEAVDGLSPWWSKADALVPTFEDAIEAVRDLTNGDDYHYDEADVRPDPAGEAIDDEVMADG